MSLNDDTPIPPSEQSELSENADRIRLLEAAVLDLLARVQHLEGEAERRRFMQALAKMKAAA